MTLLSRLLSRMAHLPPAETYDVLVERDLKATINRTGVFPERSYGLMAGNAVVDVDGMQLRWHDHWLKGEENGWSRTNR